MKKNLTILALSCFILAGCNSTKKTADGMKDTMSLSGTWELDYVADSPTPFENLYPDSKPTLTIDAANATVNGNTSCNSFNGPVVLEGTRISFTSPMAMTRKFCPGEGESTFIGSLQKISSWSVTQENTLNLIMGDIAIMRFKKI